ncbi:trypsin-like serine peptidase [Pseudomonas sp. CCOS 191]|uniref:trypsin-like serine peptidase n=1 Tax=Pseudomonas sp. CCOS 191 TaxID=1649877 RepID=UPI0018E6C0C9|nr:trypsin-like serine protease [Pseudomonas sp. CCOS 191]MBI6952013.1 trypsin-like serine protease [Pseudomonas sp. CCOS 191]
MNKITRTPSTRFRSDFMIQTNNGGLLESVPGFNAARVLSQNFPKRALPARLRQEFLGESMAFEYAFPQSSFGKDDRVPITNTAALPWRCICQLVVEGVHPNRQLLGTGWLAGPHTVITAGHNLYDPDKGRGASRITVIPGRDGDLAPFDYYVSGKFNIHDGWRNGNKHQDIGVIWLQRPLGEQLGWFGFASYTDSNLSNLIVNTSGYPADKRIGTQWFNAGRIDGMDADTLLYGLDTQAGQSGSPIFLFDEDRRRIALAVHGYGFDDHNRGIRINDEVYDLFVDWVR